MAGTLGRLFHRSSTSTHERLVRDIAAVRAEAAREPLLKWLEHRLEELQHGFLALRKTDGWQMQPHDYNQLMSELVLAASAPYIGTTKERPSEFLRKFPWVRHSPRGATRIVIADAEDIRKDAEDSPKDFSAFRDLHRDLRIALYGIEYERFAVLSEEFEFDEYMTLWPDEYLIVLAPDENHIAARLILPGADASKFGDARDYLDMLVQQSRDFDAYVAGDDGS